MAKLQYKLEANKHYETGVSEGVLFVHNGTTWENGVAWEGLTAVTESPSGAEATKLYADDGVFMTLMSTEEFGATIECYMYPDEFAGCNGELVKDGVVLGQQPRKKFAFCYKTKVVDANGNEGYKLHMIYNCLASPSERAYATINDAPEAMTFSFEVTTTPISVNGAKPTSCLTVNSTEKGIQSVIDALYGKDGAGEGDTGSESTFKTPDEIMALLKAGN